MFNDGITIITGHEARDVYTDITDELRNYPIINFPENSLHPMEAVKKGLAFVEDYAKNKTPINIRTFSLDLIMSVKYLAEMKDVPVHVVLTENKTTTVISLPDSFDPVCLSLSDSFDTLMELRRAASNKRPNKEEMEE